MTRRRWVALLAAILGGGVGVLCLVLLVTDHLRMRARAPAVEARFTELREAARTDASQSAVLQEERDAETRASLSRDERTRSLALILIGAAAMFVLGAKSLRSTRHEPCPSRERIGDVKAGGGAALLSLEGRIPARTNGSTVLDPSSDLAAVDALLDREGRSTESAIPVLQALQTRYGYLPEVSLRHVCQESAITPAQLAAVATFYAHFRRTPSGRHQVRVCHGTACHVSGAREVSEELRRALRITPENDTDPEREFTIERVACLGCCSLAPVMTVDEAPVGPLTPATAVRVLAPLRAEPKP